MGNKVIAAVIILLTVTAVFIPSLSIFTEATDYLVHFLFLLIISGLIGLIVNSRTILFTGFVCAAILALFLKNASNTELKDPKINDQGFISVAHINLSLVTNVATIQNIMNQSDLDVISFQEYTPDWANIIPHLAAKSYPFSFKDVRMDLYGKAVFSKHEIKNFYVTTYMEIPNLVVDIKKKNQNFKIISSYMVPALDKLSKEKAKYQYKMLGDDILQNHENLIILGEFNQVYWSHDIIEFRNKTKLLNSRRDINPSSFKMPYDHIFYAPMLECYNFEDISDNENNHIGCKSFFQLKKEKNKMR
ncbi:MAG: endonuclease/exonuclease/phosphatase family protein [Saprospiraceae bacterium]|nr:endonuclease/exonuclease/phosphatase family protein [Saprospiraceae bacterium]